MTVVAFRRRNASLRAVVRNRGAEPLTAHVIRPLEGIVCAAPGLPVADGFTRIIEPGTECLVELQPWAAALAVQHGLVVEEVVA
jgi:hypothetical protein